MFPLHPSPGFCFGDPHIATIDDRRYIFNGIGEYTLMEIDGVAPDNVTTNFVLQVSMAESTLFFIL